MHGIVCKTGLNKRVLASKNHNREILRIMFYLLRYSFRDHGMFISVYNNLHV